MAEATAKVAASALANWIGSFGTMDWLVSDREAHFKNEIMEGLTEEMLTSHHYTTPYSPWANGSMERMYRETLRALRAVLAEFRLAPSDWPSILECVQSVMNHAPLRRLGNSDPSISGVYRTPLQVFTGHTPTRPLIRTAPIEQYQPARDTSEVQLCQLIEVKKLQLAFDAIHKDVVGLTTHSRQKSIEQHNRKTNIQPINFVEGDLFVVRETRRMKHKLVFLWRRTRRVLSCVSPNVFVIEDLVSGKRKEIHARRIQFYKSTLDGRELSREEMSLVEHLEAHYEQVKQFRAIRKDGDTF